MITSFPTLPWKKLAFWVGGLVALVGITGFFILPPMVKSIAQKQMGAKLHREVTIEKIAINPYALTLTVNGFAIKETEGGGSFAAFEELFVDVELASVIRLAPVLKELRLTGPRIKLAHLEPGRFNFSDILDEILAKPSDGPTPRFALHNIQISRGRIDIDDKPASAKHEIADINLGIPFISSIPSQTDIFVEPKFSAKVNGAPLEVSGKSKLFRESLETEIAIEIDQFELPRLNDYLPRDLRIKIPTGQFDTRLALKFQRQPDKSATLNISGEASLSGLTITETSGKPLLKLPRLKLALTDLAPLTRHARISKLELEGAELVVRLDEASQLNWLAVLQKAKTAAPSTGPATPFLLELDELSLTRAKHSFENDASGTPWRATIDAIDLSVKNYSSANTIPLKADVSLGGLRLTKNGGKDEVLRLPLLQIKGATVDIAGLALTMGELSSNGGRLALMRDESGLIDLQSMLAPKAAPLRTAAATIATTTAEARVKDSPPEWVVTAQKIELTDYGLMLNDKAEGRNVKLSADGMLLSVQNLSTRRDAKGKFDLKTSLNKKGAVNVSGTMSLLPLAGEMNVDIKGTSILPFQPYFADKLNIDLTSGDIALKGTTRWKLAPAGEATTGQSAVTGDFSATLDLTEFASIERRSAEDLLKWKSLRVGALRGNISPLSLQIDEIALTDFYSRLIVLPEGRLNVQDIVRRPESATTAATSTVAPPPAPSPTGKDAIVSSTRAATATANLLTQIGRITLQGGNVSFTDRFIKPSHTANLTQLGGTISRITSETPADLDIRGTLDNSAPLLIAGKLNPLSKNLFLDIKASVKGFDLSPMSPYSGRYIGYGIEKGKLSLDVDYKLENRTLSAQNHLYLDQITLGDKVDSPDATKLPVSFALSLLKDRKGNIDLNLPISGSLDDPQFSIAGVVFQVIGNLIVKAVTAPFALLGSLFGGGEELSWLEFPYGYASIDAASAAKVDTLVKALTERPALKLEIAGRVDPEQDKEGLRKAGLEKSVKTQKFRDIARQGKPAVSLNEVRVEPSEYLKYLEAAYAAEQFAKPRNIVGLTKSLPKEEMEKLMLTNTGVSDEDLRQLAEQRALSVQHALLKAGIPAERIFLLTSRIETPPAKEKARASRSDLTLK